MLCIAVQETVTFHVALWSFDVPVGWRLTGVSVLLLHHRLDAVRLLLQRVLETGQICTARFINRFLESIVLPTRWDNAIALDGENALISKELLLSVMFIHDY